MALPTAQPLDANGRTIGFAGWDPVNNQYVVVSTAPGQQASGQPFAYAAYQFSPVDGGKATCSAAKIGLVPASSATDVFTITGSATKTVRVTRIEITATTTAATPAALDVLLLKRSTANSGGTSTGRPTIVTTVAAGVTFVLPWSSITAKDTVLTPMSSEVSVTVCSSC